MNVNGSGAGLATGFAMQIAVTKKIQASVHEMGQQAVQLIQASANTASSGSLGGNLNLLA